MLLSIIIPAYNAERFVKKCLDSVKGIQLDEYEVIVVDDGSSDHTKDILEEYTLDNSWLKCIYKKHQGRQKSRLDGIEFSAGEYISFLDIDDWVDEGFYEYIIRGMEAKDKVDIGIGAINRSYVDGTETPYHKTNEEQYLERDKAIQYMLDGSGFKWELCSKVYRRELFINELPREDIQVCEDLDWNWILFRNVNKCFYTPKVKYHYFMNEASTTQNITIDKMTQHFVYKRILDSMKEDDKYYGYFLKAYAKMFPRLILETVMEKGDSIRYEDIEEYQSEFRWALSRDVEDCFNSKMREAIASDVESCLMYFVSLRNKAIMDFENLKNNYSNIYVYGTGFVSAFLARWNRVFKMDVCGYVVSDGQPNQRLFNGEKVYYISEVGEEDKSVFVLAMTKNIQQKIVDYLESKGITSVYCFDSSAFSDG